jgi:hypothetical protein
MFPRLSESGSRGFCSASIQGLRLLADVNPFEPVTRSFQWRNLRDGVECILVEFWDAIITLGLGFLLALFLYPASYVLLTGWLILFEVWGLAWMRSLNPTYSWVEPLAMLPAYISVAAFWLALVLETRNHLGLAEESGTSPRSKHWSVPLSCAVFGTASLAAWRVNTIIFNLELAAAFIAPSSASVLPALFGEQVIVVITVLGLVIAVPNYGRLALSAVKRLAHSLNARWRAWRDYRSLGKEAAARKVVKKSGRPETGRSFTVPSDLLPAYNTQGVSTLYPAPLSTTPFSSDYWFPSKGPLPGSVRGMPQPMVTDSRGECSICGKGLGAEEKVLRCPRCGASAHERHFLKWLRDHAHCPRCHKPLTPYDLVEG